MLVSFWAIHHGQAASTTNMLSLSLALSLTSNYKIMVTHTQYGETRLEDSLVSNLDLYKESIISGYGINPLIRFQKNGLLNVDNFSDYAIPLIRNMRYDLLIGTECQNLEKDELLAYENTLLNVLTIADKKYDFVFVDVGSGESNKLSQKVLELSDLVVVNTSQNLYSMDKLFESTILHDIKNLIFCIGKYEEHIKSSKKNIERKYKIKKDIVVVPYNPILIDVINKGDLLDYFGRNIKGDRRGKSSFFNSVVKSASIIEKNLVKR